MISIKCVICDKVMPHNPMETHFVYDKSLYISTKSTLTVKE